MAGGGVTTPAFETNFVGATTFDASPRRNIIENTWRAIFAASNFDKYQSRAGSLMIEATGSRAPVSAIASRVAIRYDTIRNETKRNDRSYTIVARRRRVAWTETSVKWVTSRWIIYSYPLAVASYTRICLDEELLQRFSINTESPAKFWRDFRAGFRGLRLVTYGWTLARLLDPGRR